MGSIEGPRQQRKPKPWVETPLIESTALSRAAGCRIFLKLENLQPSGSFKSRAIGNLVLSYASDPANQEKQLHFFIASAGNAGLAAATAASALSYPSTVYVPMSTKSVMINKLREAGATVVQHGANLDEAGIQMRIVMDTMRGIPANGTAPVVPIALHPFDHEKIWEGVSTLVDELAYQLPPRETDIENGEGNNEALAVDGIICSVGGGGLMNGIIMGIERQQRMCGKARAGSMYGASMERRKDIHIIATETQGCDALAQAISKGSLISLPSITSLATSLGVTRVAQRTLDNALHPPAGIQVHPLVLHDADAAKGVMRLAEDQKLLVELACGVCIEAAIGPTPWKNEKSKATEKRVHGTQNAVSNANDYGTPTVTQTYLERLIPNFGPESRVVIITCGGSNVSLEMAAEWKQRLDEGWGAQDGISAW
ncbi:catabolic L-serine/threonine dehydratase [Ophidiomyces ophidiicola]|uniref:Catabolic L-serine/threonine dehydratase n=1 Tax=Ophidiomyces ophidiicola TaxID=1387563 RepID=A0ACB8UUS3_9EURO|nr:catabolic L-serine/threonine dehydratase [Ophidiomyces ophidiicola]KAI1936179.1 catabolic L-serine/threonine dehydratase [Ophidiomyces ophidiicola]KAI1962299.1 catabolic L-serine/threonine dehydratase [Ophidiomyces ophidiicola]KAI1965552.1 catabolic L-serine/threonine dehydratase [Ophidiomyces ophidiicola]KAI2039091.1 catabolic L-serine/threonine dehydratase [Ophidiomyces ophidiicola]